MVNYSLKYSPSAQILASAKSSLQNWKPLAGAMAQKMWREDSNKA